MADNNKDRDEHADSDGQRQRERGCETSRDRAAEAEPIHDDPGERLGDLDYALENIDYPITMEELIQTYGDREVETQGGVKAISEVLAPIENETYDSADDVRNRIQGLIHRG